MPFFVTAYTITKTPAEAALAAKYDLLIANQDTSPSHLAWLDSVKAINPNIKILAYQIITEEPGTAPGPGNTILMDRNRWNAAAQEPWLMTAAGDVAAITVGGWKVKRLFDYRKAVWQLSIKDACAAILAAYPFDGLFFDNCTASWSKHTAANPAAANALQNVLLDIRRAYPTKLFVGNCVENWLGLNGEMNEGRPDALAELPPADGQVVPNLNLYYMPGSVSTTDAEITATYNQIHPYTAWFGVHRTDVSMHYPSLFDSLES